MLLRPTFTFEQPTKFDLVVNLVHGSGARPNRAAIAARPRRRGDRVMRRRGSGVAVCLRAFLDTQPGGAFCSCRVDAYSNASALP